MFPLTQGDVAPAFRPLEQVCSYLMKAILILGPHSKPTLPMTGLVHYICHPKASAQCAVQNAVGNFI